MEEQDKKREKMTMELDGNVFFNSHACRITLHASASSIEVYDLVERKHVQDVDMLSVVGADVGDVKADGASSSTVAAMSTLNIHSYGYDNGSSLLSRVSCMSSSQLRSSRTISLQFGDPFMCQSWANVINRIAWSTLPITALSVTADTPPPPRRRFLVFVNPVSGVGSAMSVWVDEVQPMLVHAGVDVKLVVTQYANHARKLVHVEAGSADADELGLSLLEYDCILVIAGDGLVFEIVNGIAGRSDAAHVLRTLPIAAVPGGTGNGLAKSVLYECGEECSAINAVFVAIKGAPSPMDLSLVSTREQTFHSFLILGWGLIADIDLQSEGMRWMGETRLYVAAVYFALQRRRYDARLSFRTVPPDGTSSSGGGSSGSSGSIGASTMPAALPPLDCAIDTAIGRWEVVEGAYLLVWVVQTSHCTTCMYSGPGVCLDDGLLTVFVVEDMGRAELLQLLVAMDTGGHATHPKVKMYKCTAYRIEPLGDHEASPGQSSGTAAGAGVGAGAGGGTGGGTEVEAKAGAGAAGGGDFTVDGEQVKCGPIQGYVLPGAARVKKLRAR